MSYMFTGIITNQGIVKDWQAKKAGGRLTIKLAKPFRDVRLGESIAINGCCLTVVCQKEIHKTSDVLHFDVSDETMRKTAFAELKPGDKVNLERALAIGDRLGGHFVLGHVDGVGKIDAVKEHEGSVEYRISYPRKKSRYIIEKGSVAVDGISLTCCDTKPGKFSVYIIPHTLEETNLGVRKKGELVNLEFDMIGKYALNKGK